MNNIPDSTDSIAQKELLCLIRTNLHLHDLFKMSVGFGFQGMTNMESGVFGGIGFRGLGGLVSTVERPVGICPVGVTGFPAYFCQAEVSARRAGRVVVLEG